ncbi:hydrogenase expression/formation protein HypD [Paucidesulfovibrio gracilis DSM 16080]|uniref:Hydrogenase expression/formation protein HypD n=1 Tax=Paucidesulfovibrio gracilis DSM 16080 TaxID=1121449 RepID=A0A1T4WBD0_9BACT|nr:hydrogenase formation protein HypD [Paucidesulfovibrio gracilis]SKA74606.1 hydrogenase expression/formation protein HypD [Paucidesulfovibrio gracilis DSM 16080]
MSLKLLDEFHDPKLCRGLLDRLHSLVDREFRFMEVCGTHTVAIFQSGLRSLLPEQVVHLSGPGCPVCVTHESEVNAFIDLAERDDVVVATFGDLMRVPGSRGRSLKKAQADGARVEVVYSPPDALKLAADNPDKTVVFLGVGFETTAPTVAGTLLMAREQGLTNFRVLSFHKLVPPALGALMADPEVRIDAFIMPGHVSAIIGVEPYRAVADQFGKSSAVTGFEPADILGSLVYLVERWKEGKPAAANLYPRVVRDGGNAKARAVMDQVFQTTDALWRGLGMIPNSGLELRPEFEQFDAKKWFGLEIEECPALPGCRCGDVLKGKLRPDQCPLFKKACTPANPVGPCMVSTEGSCAAYFKYSMD